MAKETGWEWREQAKKTPKPGIRVGLEYTGFSDVALFRGLLQ